MKNKTNNFPEPIGIDRFKQFDLKNIIYLKGGLGGVVTGSRTFEGRSYIDILFDNGGYMCDYQVSQNTDGVAGGADDAVGTPIIW